MIDQPLQSADPKMVIDWSDDHGRSWSNGRSISMGKVGEYRVRCKTHRLGNARDRVYRVTISDPVKRVILSADLDAVGGTN